MKRLHLYVIKSFLGPFFMTFFICVFVLLMQFLWKYVDDMVGKGLEWGVIGEILFYASFGLLPFAFPLSMLIASIMTFGSLGENYELVAMKSSGISLLRIMRPLIVLAISITILAFYFSNNVLPHTNLRLVTLIVSVKEQSPDLILKEGVFTNEIDGYNIRVNKKDDKTNMLYDILIYDHTHNKANEDVTVADSGFLRITEDKKYMVLTLYSGIKYDEENPYNRSKNRTYTRNESKFEKQVVNIKVSNFEFKRRDESIFKNNYRMLNLNQLSSSEDSLHIDYNRRVQDFIKQANFNPIVNKRLYRAFVMNDSIRSIAREKPDTLFNYDQLFADLEKYKKGEVIQSSVSFARSNHLQVSNSLNNLYNKKKFINKYEIERHKKFSLSIAVLIFFFIGAPLGAIIRKGGLGMPVVVSVFLFILYYVVSLSGEKSAREDVWNMAFGMWFSSAIFLPLGIWFTYKAVTDSAIMRSETYSDIFKKFNVKRKLFFRKSATIKTND